jgi:N-acetylmuramoyl-L-alanine amidase
MEAAVDLRQLEALIARLSEDDRKEIEKLAANELARPFIPNPGPQTNALLSDADILLYGGQAGSGKTSLEVGCAALDHYNGLILRREATQLDGLIQFSHEVFDGVGEFNKVEKVWTWGGGRTLKFAGLQQADDWRKHAGNARDYFAFDEAAEFLKEQVFSLIGWLRSTREGQRCRVILGSNPPRSSDGMWVIEEFAPWLDPLFPNPAASGELRWAIVVANETEWVDGPGKYMRAGEEYEAMSRTFIPASLNDNPYLRDTGYRAKLQQLPEPLRSQLLHGDFLAGREDDEWQVIPSSWVRAAQARWPGEPKSRMKAIAIDPAQGGPDKTAISRLHEGNHFASIESRPGAETPDGPSVAALILKLRRDNAAIGIDMTGGWGGSARDHLKTNNEISAVPIVFSAAGDGTDKDTRLEYANLRAKMYWEFRTALDPDGGEDIKLPPGDKLPAQLTAGTWKERSGKILIESKDDIKKRLGVSPDEADAVVMAWYIRDRAIRDAAKLKRPKLRAPGGLGAQGWMAR